MLWCIVLMLPLTAEAAQTGPLQISVFYEALCPDSRGAFVNQIWPTWSAVHSIVNFTLIPWGKAELGDNGTIRCQFDETECWGNRLHGCVIGAAGDAHARLRAVTCLEREQRRLQEQAPACVQEAGLSWRRMQECAVSAASHQTALAYHAATAKLDPPLHFVPTFTLDGSQGSAEDQRSMSKNLLKFVCQKWKERGGLMHPGCLANS